MDEISLAHEARRGTLRFRLAPGMNIYTRLVLFVILTTAGASLMFRVNGPLGAPVFLAGLAFLMVRGVSNTRKAPDTSKDRWVVGSAMDLRKIERKAQQAKRLPSNQMDGLTGAGFASALAVAGVCAYMDFEIIPEYLFAEHMAAILFIQGSMLIAVFFTAGARA